MKKALRGILPILLILTILVSSVWYLAVYDPEFTRDSILTAARQFDKSSQHKIAAWLYDLAYRQSGGGDDVAIELAEHYKSIGNYTKAEYTLSKAISDGGTVDLYIALCKTYVEQDKILDAINMLDNIRDAEIKATIDQMRPAAPTFDPAPGFYSQYITVNVTGDGSDLYVNAKGEYPSTADPVETSIQLPEGETTIYAVCIGEDYLVSPLSIRGYTIGGVVKQITISDSALNTYIRSMLNVSSNSVIYTNDLWDITELALPEDVTSYQDLALFPYLKSLTIRSTGNADLSVLSNLSGLTELSITGVTLNQESLMAIGNLRMLEKLTLSRCNLSTVAPLSNLTNLISLDLSNNTLRNIGIFSGFKKLQSLNMEANALTDLSALSNLTDLRELNVSNNSIQTLQPIYGNSSLEELYASHNSIDSIDGIQSLSALKVLTLEQNLLSNISFLSGCEALTELDVSNNSISDVSVIGALTKLIRLDISYNQVNTLPKFGTNHQLGSLDASHNDITTIVTLNTLNNLYFVDLDYNERLESIDALLECRNISKVNCIHTRVYRNPFPEDFSVVVNYSVNINGN